MMYFYPKNGNFRNFGPSKFGKDKNRNRSERALKRHPKMIIGTCTFSVQRPRAIGCPGTDL